MKQHSTTCFCTCAFYSSSRDLCLSSTLCGFRVWDVKAVLTFKYFVMENLLEVFAMESIYICNVLKIYQVVQNFNSNFHFLLSFLQ